MYASQYMIDPLTQDLNIHLMYVRISGKGIAMFGLAYI
jgi:hypothetical protein